MMRCWQNEPDARQTFTELKNELEDMGILLNPVSFKSNHSDVFFSVISPRFHNQHC